jgi:hypothetical protein
MATYGYIIVGAGSTGCVPAAGPSEECDVMARPLAPTTLAA